MTISQAISQRILLLDGAMGSLLQSRLPHYRGLADALVIDQPQEIAQIHRAYLAAGADCITTCTFSSHGNPLINLYAARLARQVADQYTVTTGQQRFVLGDVGPTEYMLSTMHCAQPDDGERAFRMLAEAYRIQMEALLQGGADALLIETVTDIRNLRAALLAAEQLAQRAGAMPPMIVCMTVAGESGCMLSGHMIPMFVETALAAQPLAVGLNCGYGARAMLPYLRQMQEAVNQRCCLCCYPNAGLPNAEGRYGHTPDEMAQVIQTMIREGMLNMVGGCCGTTPEYIRIFRMMIDNLRT